MIRHALLFGAAFLVLGLSEASHAQESVWDPEEIARLAQKSAQMAEALSRTVELLGEVNDLSRTMGRFGSLSSLDFSRFDLVEGMKGAGPEIGGVAATIAGAKPIHSFEDASAFVKQLTTPPKDGDKTTKAHQILQALDGLSRKASEDGFALATHVRQALSLAPERAKQLTAEARTAGSLREDVTANSAAGLAVLEQLEQMKATLALVLEIQSIRRLATKQSAGSQP